MILKYIRVKDIGVCECECRFHARLTMAGRLAALKPGLGKLLRLMEGYPPGGPPPQLPTTDKKQGKLDTTMSAALRRLHSHYISQCRRKRNYYLIVFCHLEVNL